MAEHTTVGQRFSLLISHLGITKNAFAASLDKTATVIQHLVDERNKPGFDLLNKVFEVYPNVSKDWLMQGAGPMLTNAARTASPAPAAVKQEAIQVGTPVLATNPVAPEPVGTAKQVAPAAVASEAESIPAQVSNPVSSTAPESVELPQAGQGVAGANIPAAVAPEAGWQSALYTQQMAHQLALAELRNQHLQEQQRLMQQMLDLMQRRM